MSDHHAQEPQYPAFVALFKIIQLIGKLPVMIISLSIVALAAGGVAQWTFGNYWINIIIACLAISGVIENFLVSVPEITGLITINIFTGELDVYGTGFHLIFPWEQVEEGNYINLRQVTVPVDETYPSLDSLMAVKWQFQYTPTVAGLKKYISADDNTIKTGLKGLGGSVIGFEIGILSGEECKKQKDAIEEKVKDRFVSEDDDPDLTPWALYGVEMNRVTINDLDYDSKVQEVRSNMEVSRKIREMAGEIRNEHRDLTGAQAMNYAMIINGKTQKQIFELEGLGSLAPFLAKLAEKFNKKG